MAERQPETIILGGREFKIRPLNFAQLKRAMPLFKVIPAAMEQQSLDEVGELFLTALSRESDMTADKLQAMEISMEEIGPAMDAIARLAGLKLAEAKPGEAPGKA